MTPREQGFLYLGVPVALWYLSLCLHSHRILPVPLLSGHCHILPFTLMGGSLGHPHSPLLPPPWTLPPLRAVCTCIPPSQASARGSRHCCPLSALLSILYVLRPRPLLWRLPFPSPVLSPLPESPALIHGPCVNFEVVLPMPPFHL